MPNLATLKNVAGLVDCREQAVDPSRNTGLLAVTVDRERVAP
jgi:hypothetical protein